MKSTHRKPPAKEIRELSVLEHLHEINIFKPLSDDDIEAIAGSSETKTFHPGEMVIQKDDTDNSLFIISSGVVSILEKDSMGQHMEITRLSTSEYFGEMSLLTGEPRSAIVKALTSVKVINVPKEALEPILKAKPELSDKLAQIMADRRTRTEAFIDSIRKPSSLATTRSYVTRIRSFFGLNIV